MDEFWIGIEYVLDNEHGASEEPSSEQQEWWMDFSEYIPTMEELGSWDTVNVR